MQKPNIGLLKMAAKLTLLFIEYCIRANCLIDDSQPKRLTMYKYMNFKSKLAARAFFIYFALMAGHEPGDIREFLDMSETEYDDRLDQFDEIKQSGDRMTAGELAPDETIMHFYRKILLIRNMLRLRG